MNKVCKNCEIAKYGCPEHNDMLEFCDAFDMYYTLVQNVKNATVDECVDTMRDCFGQGSLETMRQVERLKN